MIRSSRATGKQTRATAVPGVSPQIAAMLSSSLPFQGDATELYAQLNNSGQRRRISTRPAPQANLVRLPLEPPSPPPTWGSFTGGNGLFSGRISRPSVRLAESVLDQLQYQVELADNTAFSTNVISLDLGNARKFEHRLSSATKFARLRARWVTSDWTAWVAFGSPTSVASGVPVSGSGDIADGSVTDPKITGTRSLVASGAVDASKNVDLAGTAWVNKHLDNIPDGTTYGRPLATRLNASRPFIDFAETIHSNKHLGNMPDDAVSDRRAATANEKTGGTRGFNALTSSNNLASGIKVGGDSGLLGQRVSDALIDTGSEGRVRLGRFSASGTGLKSTAQIFASGTGSSSGWVAVGTGVIDVPAGATSVTFNMGTTFNGSGTKQLDATGADNVGFSITNGAGGATPQVSRVGAGSLTQNSPVTGNGLTLTVYANIDVAGGISNSITIQAKQDVYQVSAAGSVA